MVQRLLATRTPLKLPVELIEKLRCPVCRSTLRWGLELCCTNGRCQSRFPIVEGVPALIHEQASLFSIEQAAGEAERTANRRPRPLRSFLRYAVPKISANVRARANYRRFREELLRRNPAPQVLILGGGRLGAGLTEILPSAEIRFIESDLRFSERTVLLCDAHDIPFADQTFDGVIIQAVLEHVPDPFRCVAEIHRVLGEDGLVYAETAFMQQVHGGPFDFTRFTHLGHRRLFRRFEEIASGAACGPAMALAWAFQHLLLSFCRGGMTRAAAIVFAAWTTFWLKYLDRFLIDKPGALDAASALYFLGVKGRRRVTDREIAAMYRGCQ